MSSPSEPSVTGVFAKPKGLAPPQVIGVVALASPVRDEFLTRGKHALEAHGFQVKLGPSVLARSRYTAGSTEERLTDFVSLWFDDEVDAIFCARGGFGSLELLDHLDPGKFTGAPKIFMGASDLTAVHCFLGAKAGLVSFHGPMVAQKIARGDDDHRQWMDLLTQTGAGHRIDWAGAEFLHPGVAEGRLWGGCLSILVSLVGTPYFPDLNDSVLFIEDRGVKPYQIDRMLLQLRMSGNLKNVRALIFGEMLDCDQHPEQGYTLSELLFDLTKDYGIPVVVGYPSGHTSAVSRTLPIGVRVRMGPAGIELLEGVVT